MHTLSAEELNHRLTKKGFKKTPQRLAIISYLKGNLSHPTAMDIYQDLKPKYPSLSRATIYNTLQMLIEVGLIKEHHFSKDRVHYDPDLSLHHHFVCERCNQIIDVRLDETQTNFFHHFSDQTNHQVKKLNLTAFGLCQECLDE